MSLANYYATAKSFLDSFNIFRKFFVLVFVFSMGQASIDIANAENPLPTFIDPAMQACMDEIAAEKDWHFAEEVKSFSCTDRGVTQLDGIDALTDLKRLNLNGNEIADVNPLSSLTQLTRLSLSGNSGIDINQLLPIIQQNHGLTHLGLNDIVVPDGNLLFLPPDYGFVKLALANTRLNDISHLSSFPNLQILNLRGNRIVDVAALQNMNQLKRLDLSNNAEIDFHRVVPLIHQNSGLTHLGMSGIVNPDGNLLFLPPDYDFVKLALANTRLDDISHLSSFPNLQILNLRGNRVIDVTALQNMNQLKRLDLSNNADIDFHSVVPLIHQNPGLTHLGMTDITNPDGNLMFLPPGYDFVKLALANTGLHDISQLSLFPNLEVLDLKGNQIAHVDFSVIENMRKLKRLNLSDNAGIDFFIVSVLMDQNPDLTHLGISGIAVPGGVLFLDPESDFVELELANTQLNDISSLSHFPNLEVLDLKGNQIAHVDLSVIENMQKLRRLNLSDNAGIDFFIVSVLLDQNPDLTHLGISGIAVPGGVLFLDPESDFVELELANTQLNDISSLSHFPNLEVLDLKGNQIAHVDFSVIENMRKLKRLNLSDNAGIDFFIVSVLLDQNPDLTHLGISGIAVPGGVLFLDPASDFVELELANTQLHDISPLSHFPNLEVLDLKGNQIAHVDFSVIENMRKLKRLNLSDNAGIDFFIVSVLLDQNPDLTHLGISGIAVPGGVLFLDPESDFVELELANTQLNDISSLSHFPNLEVLDLKGNQIADLNALQPLRNLGWLNLSDNPFIMDLNPLLSLTALTYLNLSGNNQLQCAELDLLESAFPPDTVIRPTSCAGGTML